MRSSLLVVALAASLTTAGAAQGGYRDIEDPGRGLEYPCAKDYEALPVEPTEEWIVAQWIEELPRDPDDRKALRPTLAIVWIDWVPDPEPPRDGEGVTTTTPEEGAQEPPPINTLRRWAEQRLGGSRLEPIAEQEPVDGHVARTYEVFPERGAGPARTWAFEYRNDARTVAFVGTCHADDWGDQTRIWHTMARKARFREPTGDGTEKWLAYYERRPQFVDAAYRARIRSGLPRGWEADDTENYPFVFSTKDEPLLRRLKRDLEAIRAEYQVFFPPVAPITAVSTVRICKDRDEYLQYGGPPGSGGYWNAAAQELVFFNYDSLDEVGRKKRGTANALIVLYHEAFHQYIHYSAGELPPHSWFNEGTGDFYSGAVISGGRVKKIGVNPWRIGLIQGAIDTNRTVPWREITRYEQGQYYANAAQNYAQGWSMIYFLRTSRKAQKHPEWSRILDTYFEELKSAYAVELTEIGDGADPEARQQAGQAARERAVEAAFADVDYEELEEAWKQYILGLKAPRN